MPAASIALAALLAGCTAFSGPAAVEAPFPNLGAIPAGPPPVSSSEERRAQADRLAADRLEAGRAKADVTGAPESGPSTDRLD